METTTLSELLKNDYKEKPKENVKEFTLDNDLSGKRVKVYVDGQGNFWVTFEWYEHKSIPSFC